MSLARFLKVMPQYVLPQHSLSVLMSQLTHSKNKTLKNIFIREIIKRYGVNMSESLQQDIHSFNSFNEFFTRELNPQMRPLARGDAIIVSPADGVISQAGTIIDGQIFQAKGKSFSAVDLLGGDNKRASTFNGGLFTTIYLSPKDYHRLHMPLTGRLIEMVHIPGKLFSVNTITTENVSGLFARNERVVAIFETELGKMALVLVGAIFVSSIETVWHGVVTPPTSKTIRSWQYADNAPLLEKGQEMGRFNMGSTIIVLFEKDKARWHADIDAGKAVKLKTALGSYIN